MRALSIFLIALVCATSAHAWESEEHRAAKRDTAAWARYRGHRVISGGDRPESRVYTPNGSREYRSPDVMIEGRRSGRRFCIQCVRGPYGSMPPREYGAARDLRGQGYPTMYRDFTRGGRMYGPRGGGGGYEGRGYGYGGGGYGGGGAGGNPWGRFNLQRNW